MAPFHMNEYIEWGAPVLPKMLADNIDAHLEPAHDVIKDAISGELYKIGNVSKKLL